MGLLDEPINFPSAQELFTVPVLAGAGVGVFAAFQVFKAPSIAQMLGLSLLGGLGGFYLEPMLSAGAPAPRTPRPTPTPTPATPALPTLDLGGFFQNAVNTVQDALENITHPSPSPTPTGGTTVTTTAPGAFMPAGTAYALVQQGKYHTHVKFSKLSRFYNWSDFMVSSSISDANRKSIPLSAYQNAAKLGLGLDKLCQATGGKKITVNSWQRIQVASSNHKTGAAADLGGSLSYGYIKGTLYPAARRIGDFKGVGYPTIETHKSLHVDILANHGCPSNMQFDFVDNGDGNYTGACKPLLGQSLTPSPSPAPAKTSTKTSILPKAGSIPIPTAPAPRPLPYIPMPIILPSLPTASGPVYGPGDVSGSIIQYN